MAFTGTLDKCKACDKTVYVVDMLSLEGLPYHKSCFKCSHCKGFLSMSTYSSMDGVLYCKPHFEQLFKESGNFSKNFQPKSAEKQNEQLGPQQALLHVLWNPRQVCNLLKDSLSTGEGDIGGRKLPQVMLQVCSWGCPLTHSSYAALDGVLYCKHHFSQLFLEKGNYSHVLQAAANRKNALATEPAAAEAPPEPQPEPTTEAESKDQTDQPPPEES
ncbi:GATA type zinc finger transcription factor family protein [Prunus dulcis]|uniref:GATA type zinc finger transcription factor family protein n=1 Tax=Prunus dulcis TaxID=3755 RepID=A0A4Y1R0B0_PRUDU|nr:GATA type zinc finger transcription factor family protein [Prunus dulcis]